MSVFMSYFSSKPPSCILECKFYEQVWCFYFFWLSTNTSAEWVSEVMWPPWTVACLPGFSVHGIFQQEYWSGLPFPPPGGLHNPGIKPTSPTSPTLAGIFFTTEPPGKPREMIRNHNILFSLIVNAQGTILRMAVPEGLKVKYDSKHCPQTDFLLIK